MDWLSEILVGEDGFYGKKIDDDAIAYGPNKRILAQASRLVYCIRVGGSQPTAMTFENNLMKKMTNTWEKNKTKLVFVSYKANALWIKKDVDSQLDFFP